MTASEERAAARRSDFQAALAEFEAEVLDPAASLPEPTLHMTDRDRRRAERKKAFVREYARHGSKVRAARVAHGTEPGKNPPVSLYDRWALADPEFREAVESARIISLERIRDRIMGLAMNDEFEEVVSGGRIVRHEDGSPLMRKKRDTNSLLAVARAYLPEFAKKSTVEINATVEKRGGVIGWTISPDDLLCLSREQSDQLAGIIMTIRQSRGEWLSLDEQRREYRELIDITPENDD